MEKRLTKLLPYGIALEVLVLFLSYFESDGNTTLFFQAAARMSGRVSLLFFLIFGIYATRYPSVSDVFLVIKTKLVTDFAILHIIHWFLLAAAVKLSGFELVPYRLAGGALAYGMVLTMPFIYQKKVLSSLPLTTMQNVYIFYVWLIFFMTYLPRLQGKVPTATGSMPAYLFFMAITTAFLVWRIIEMNKKKSWKQA